MFIPWAAILAVVGAVGSAGLTFVDTVRRSNGKSGLGITIGKKKR